MGGVQSDVAEHSLFNFFGKELRLLTQIPLASITILSVH